MAGKIQQAKGRVKEAAGTLSGNQKLKRSGQIDQVAGKVKEVVGKMAHKANKDCGCGS